MKKGIVMAALGILLLPLSMSGAYAAGDCIVTPEKTETVRHAAVEHQEYRWKKEIPAIQELSHEEFRYVRTNPGSEAVTHTEYQFKRTNPGREETFRTEFKYKKVIPAVDGVKECEYKKSVDDFKIQYHFAKYTQTREGEKVKGEIVWGPWGEWEKWKPETHTSWQDSSDPLGSPAPHASGHDGKVYWERVWQARWDGKTQEVKTGSHYEYEWFTENPGSSWIKTDTCRWKVEPIPEQTVLYNDGDWTTEVLDDPWIEIDRQSVGNGDAVASFAEYKTESGVSTVEGDAAWFTENAFDGWTQFNSKTVTDKEAVPPFDEWATKSGQTTNVNEADYFTEAEAATLDPGWSKYGEPLKVVDQEYVSGYLVFYVEDGEPTRELGDTNWTTDNPGKPWLPVDERTVVDAKAYTTSKVVPAVYGPCKLAETGSNETAVLVVVALGLLALGGTLVVLKNRLT